MCTATVSSILDLFTIETVSNNERYRTLRDRLSKVTGIEIGIRMDRGRKKEEERNSCESK